MERRGKWEMYESAERRPHVSIERDTKDEKQQMLQGLHLTGFVAASGIERSISYPSCPFLFPTLCISLLLLQYFASLSFGQHSPPAARALLRLG